MKEASVTRHDVIHGFPIHHASETDEAKLVRLNIGRDRWELPHREVIITIAFVTEAAAVAQALATRGSDWVKMMVDEYERVVGPIPV